MQFCLVEYDKRLILSAAIRNLIRFDNLLIVIVVVSPGTAVVLSLFTDRYLDTLVGEAFAERRTLANSREFLGRVDLERRTVSHCKDWDPARIDLERITGLLVALGVGHPNTGKRKSQPI